MEHSHYTGISSMHKTTMTETLSRNLEALDDEDRPIPEFVVCQACCEIVVEDKAKVMPGGIVCPECYAAIINNIRPKFDLKQKAAEIKSKHRFNPLKRRLGTVAPKPRPAQEKIRELVNARNSWELFMLPYPIIRSYHAKILGSADPSEWLLNPTPVELPRRGILSKVEKYISIETINKLIHQVVIYEDDVTLSATQVLSSVGLSVATFGNLLECANEPVQLWGLQINRGIYEKELLNKQIALSLLAPYILADVEKLPSLNKQERFIGVRSGTLLRSICQANDTSTLSGNIIEKLMNFYDIDTDAIGRAKIRLADCALLNCS